MKFYKNFTQTSTALLEVERIFKIIKEGSPSSVIGWSENTLKNEEEKLKQEQHPVVDVLKEVRALKSDNKYSMYYRTLKPYADKILDIISDEVEELKQFEYKYIQIDHERYKMKTCYYDDNKDIQYLIASFQSRQQHDAFLANLQKGYKTIRIQTSSSYIGAIRNGYISKVARVNDENSGDGIHAIIFTRPSDDIILRVHQHQNVVDELYKWIHKNTKTALIPEWKEYIYNHLSDMDMIHECEGFDLTNKAPKVYKISNDVDTDLIRTIKTVGLKQGFISLPVEKNEVLDTSMPFLEMIKKYVINHIADEKAHYNIGEPISNIISSPIIQQSGKKTVLYPRQQVIAQGLNNAIKEGKYSLFLNGGTGIGKTYTSIKLTYASIKEHFNRDNGRVVVYAQGHLIPKWKRQFNECLNPLGVKPIFYEITTLKDLKKLDEKPKGFEVFLLPKDRVKRNYQVDFASNQRFDKSLLRKVNAFITNNEDLKIEDVGIIEANDLPIHSMKYAAQKLGNSLDKCIILFKKQFDEEGNIKGYKFVTTSDLIKNEFGCSHKSYDFMLNDMNDLTKYVEDNATILLNEAELNKSSQSFIQHGIICPDCGGFIYKSPFQFDEDEYKHNLHVEPSSKNQYNRACQNYIKADGTPLTKFEEELIRNKRIESIVTDKFEKECYLDEDNNPLEPEQLLKVKSGQLKSGYSIVIKKCNSTHWSAVPKKGYRTVNLAQMLLKKFGKNSFDFLIADEVHLYQKESEQGITFGYLCKLCKINLGLTGTLTGGKASDLYYTFWRMFPSKMVQLGYKYQDVSTFVDHYGRKKKVTKEYNSTENYNKSGKGKTVSSGWQECPGISPMLYTNFLSGCMVSRKLDDMGIPLPKIDYFKHSIEMSDSLKDNYNNLKDQIIAFMKQYEVSVGGSYINALLSYPDMPNQEPLMWRDELLIANPVKMDIKDTLLPKEKKLIETVKREIAEGRKVIVYSVFSGKKGVSKRLMDILKAADIKAVELTSSIPLQKREDWIEKQSRSFDCLVTNPTCVETGLDMIQFATIYFYEVSYNVKTIRQAEKRIWRVGQPLDCRIYYSYYADSLQEDCLKLVGSKKKASLALEGVFSEDMLSSMGEGGDSGASVLYKALKGEITLKEEELDAFGFKDESTIIDAEIIVDNSTVNDAEVIDNNSTSKVNIKPKKSKNKHQMEVFTVDVDKLKGRKKKQIAEGQLSFFSL